MCDFSLGSSLLLVGINKVQLPGLLCVCLRALDFYTLDISFYSAKTSCNDTPKSLSSEKAGTLKTSENISSVSSQHWSFLLSGRLEKFDRVT